MLLERSNCRELEQGGNSRLHWQKCWCWGKNCDDLLGAVRGMRWWDGEELVALQCHTLRRPNNGPNTGAIRKLNINKSYIMVTTVSLIQFCLEQGRHYPSLLWRSQLKLILDVHKYTTSHSVLCGSWDGNISMERTVTIQPSLQVTVW